MLSTDRLISHIEPNGPIAVVDFKERRVQILIVLKWLKQDLCFSIALWIDCFWQVVEESVVYCQLECGLREGQEYRLAVHFHIDLQTKVEKSLENVAMPDSQLV